MKKGRRDNKRDNDSRPFEQRFRSNFGGGFQSGPREMHPAKCSDCGCDCEVPFKPTEGKPVYCRECFRKKKSSW